MPDVGYAVTFFPEVQKLADAVSVRVGPGQEIGGIDIFLMLVHTVRIRGRVSSALSGHVVPGPSITLRWNDPDNTASLIAPVDVAYDRDQNFEIKRVPSGPYLAIVTGVDDGRTLSARVPIVVGDTDIADLGIVIGPEQNWDGKVMVDGDDSAIPSGLQISLQPRRTTAAQRRVAVTPTGEFSAPIVPEETYDPYVLNAPADAYLKAVKVNNSDRLVSGLEVQPGETPRAMEIVLSMDGAKVAGRAVTSDPNMVASGATIQLIPDPLAGRVQAYKTSFADEYGNFLLTGVAPGPYILVAWIDQPPCEIYNSGDAAACRAHGVSLDIPEGAPDRTIDGQLIPASVF